MKRGKGTFPALAMMVLLLCTAGCTTPPIPSSEAKLCQDIAEMESGLQNFERLDPGCTVHRLRVAQDQLTCAMEDGHTAADEMEDMRIDRSGTPLRIRDLIGWLTPPFGQYHLRNG